MFDLDEIKHFYNVLDLLKKFNIYIHLGNRLDDLKLAEVELNRLFRANLIDRDIYLRSMTIVKSEIRKEENNE
ncbi:YqgQ family protein [Xylocopilactobacillus apicola]|uniref:DUF910 family protein n=1 Tax=Xylocopilactobacillus apicola TaxID=2932184 RepID=A0AAU9DIX1_9LACO|nr:YqgQ family protein [Xylocopilactobacillus apicola]BDR58396.1 hypothetical protein XA3_08370 [Xylocopilactobacillus apicola]